MPDTFDTLRPYLADYLRARGIDPRRCFRCLNPDRNPSMAYDARRHKVYCFAYDADYDPFDLFTIDHSCSSLLKALASASRLYGHGDVAVSRTATEPTRRAADGRGGECPAADPSHTERGDLAMSPEQIATYLGSCAEKRGQTHYFSSRGISEANAVRFSLGYDGVLDGKRYPHYPPAEVTHLAEAKQRYGSYAKHLWFREGDHETSLDFLRAEVARHIRETGTRPVVLIDYLQIIAPVDVHFSDKQYLDRIVCSLKKLSCEQELTIVAISSFNRENYNMEVSMSAFKESGGIDYSADVLIGLQAKGAGKPGFNIDEAKRADPREIELRILKNRSAAIPQPIPYRYYPAYSCFEELT